MKRVGYIDGRRIRYVADGVTKFAIHSWGIIMGCVTGSMSLYLAADYGAYITSILAGELDLCASTSVNIRVSPSGKAFVVTAGAFTTNKLVTFSQGLIITDTAYLRLPMIDGGTADEATIWYVPSTDQLQYMAGAGVKKTIATT